jgi:hypothetical protein
MYRSQSEDAPNNTFLFLSIKHSSECVYYNTLIVYGKESIPTHGVESIPQLVFDGVKSIPMVRKR